MLDVADIKVQPGDPIKADQFMALVAAVRDLRDMRGGNGIDIRRVGGRIAISAIPESVGFLAVATSNFAARSGTTPGTGTADLWRYDGTVLLATGKSVTAVNVSTTTMTSGNSIDSGMYCWVVRDAWNKWFISPLECS